MKRSYHHGDLRREILGAAVEAIAETGPAALSLRDLARRAGVSHAAPAYHFGGKRGLLRAVASEGYELLFDAADQAHAGGGGFTEVAVAYVRFAVSHRGHFAVMYRPDLYSSGAPELMAARERAWQLLYEGVRSLPDARSAADSRAAAVAVWSLMHGFATLWLGGNLHINHADLVDDPEEAARTAVRALLRGCSTQT